MKKKANVELKPSQAELKVEEKKLGPHLQFVEKPKKENDPRRKLELILSDGKPLTEDRVDKALKNTTGTEEESYAMPILMHIANGFTGDTLEIMNRIAQILPTFKPQDETEAILFGQLLALQEAANKCLRRGESSDMYAHFEMNFNLANKLFNTANQTLHAISKYRTGGKQLVQVVHLHNEGQAIVTQALSQPPMGGRPNEKTEE